jgi:hypothetical protein
MLVGIAAVAFVLASGKRVLLVWDFHRRSPASERLLRPLIEYHGKVADSYRATEQEELRLVRFRSQGIGKLFGRAVRSVWRTAPQYPLPVEVQEFWAFTRALAEHHPGNQGPTVLENYRDSVWASHMAAYHSHMRDHYTRLRAEHLTELPPMPAVLQAELRACETELRGNRDNPALDLYDETAPYLRPGAPKPERSASSSSQGDSF